MKVSGFERPEVPVLSVLSLIVGVGACVWLLPADWSLVTKVLAGVALAVTTVISLFANRMIGGTDFE